MPLATPQGVTLDGANRPAKGDPEEHTRVVRTTAATPHRDDADPGSVASATAKALDAAVSGWRLDLLRGAQFDAPVAASMSRVIADLNVATLGLTEQLRATQEATARIIAKRFEPLAGVMETLRESIVKAIQPAAFLAASGLGEQLRRASEVQREYDTALMKMGWWFPPSMPLNYFWEVGRLAHEGDRLGVRHALLSLGRHREMFAYVESWMDCDSFRDRRRFIMDGLRDHRRGRFRVSIPTLLPLLEGIAIEELAPGAEHGPKDHIKNAVALYKSAEGEALVEAVTILWARTGFGQIARNSRELNRHVILHGRSTGYGTEVNSAKVLFAFDLLHSLVETKRRKA